MAANISIPREPLRTGVEWRRDDASRAEEIFRNGARHRRRLRIGRQTDEQRIQRRR